MSHFNISNIVVNNNPSSFQSSFHFTVTFECLQPLKEEIQWKVIYVGSPKDASYDQEIDCFGIGPFDSTGIMQFNIESKAPDVSRIPNDDILGVAAIIHSVSYQKQEFFRVGYFVYNNYEDPFLVENPYPIQVDKIVRSVLAEKPRIIRHNIDWESQTNEKMRALNEILEENAKVKQGNSTIQFNGIFSDMESQNKSGGTSTFGGFGGFQWNSNNGLQNNNQNDFEMEKENYNGQGGLFSDKQNQQFNSGCFMNQGNVGMNESGFFGQQQTGNEFILMEQNGRNQGFGNGFYNQ